MMTRHMTLLAAAALTAATLSTSGAHAQAMSMEFNMLTGAVFNALKSRGLPTDNIDQLTLSQIAIIKGILDSDEPEAKKNERIEAVMNR